MEVHMMGCEKNGKYMKLCPFSLGLAIGVTCGLLMMFYAWVAAWYGWGMVMVTQYGAIFYGYAPTVIGGIVGGLWGLLKGFIFGFIIALVYNLCVGCKFKGCSKSCSCECCSPTNKTKA